MKMRVLAAGLLTLVALSTTALAQQTPDPSADPQNQGQPGGGGGPGGRGGQGNGNQAMQDRINPYNVIERELKLTDEEKTAVKAKCDEIAKEIREIQNQIRAKFASAFGGPNGNGGGDAQENRSQLMQEVQELAKQADAAYFKGQKDIEALLTPEQAAKWEGFKFERALIARLGRVQLTDEQGKKLKNMAEKAGAEIVKAADEKAAMELKGKLTKKILTEVLTDEQIARMAGLEDTLGLDNMRMGGGMGGGRGNNGGGMRNGGGGNGGNNAGGMGGGRRGGGNGGGRRGGGNRGGGNQTGGDNNTGN